MKAKRVRDHMAGDTRAAGVSTHTAGAASHAGLAKASRARDKVVRPAKPQIARAELLGQVGARSLPRTRLTPRSSAQAVQRGNARVSAPGHCSAEPSAACVARRSYRRHAPARHAQARALRLRSTRAGRGAGSPVGLAAARGARERRGGRHRGAERGVLLARSGALGAARQGRGEPPVAHRVRGRAGARRAGRVERGAPRADRADDQGEPPHRDVCGGALRPARPGPFRSRRASGRRSRSSAARSGTSAAGSCSPRWP